MRKILIGGLGVAGLLATVLAIASSPASSQMVIAFRTDSEPGTYTVSWSTQGGCDPSKPDADTTLATDGATGSVSRTVAVPSGTAATATVGLTGGDDITGTQVEFSVAVAGHCRYEWSGTFTSSLGGSDGIRCAVGAGDDEAAGVAAALRTGVLSITEDPADVVDTVHLGVDEDVCNVVNKIVVDIDRPTTTNEDGDTVQTQPHSGAILNTEFTVGAEQAEFSGYSPNDECVTVAEQSEVDDKDTTIGRDATDDDTVGAVLTVVQTPLSDGTHTCAYNVGVQLPDGFDTATPNSNATRVVSYALTPPNKLNEAGDTVDDPTTTADCGQEVITEAGTDGVFNTDDDVTGVVSGQPCFTAQVRVALRMIYILQNVVGDSGGANAKYSLTLDSACAIPHDLPENLTPREIGGIKTTTETVVELREGFYNISAAVMGRDTTDIDDYGRTFAPRYALNKDAEACSFTAAVSELPGACDAAEGSITVNAVTGADSHGRVIATFDIGCNGDDEEEAMDDGDDMGDMDDGAADDMGDMDGGDAMGPPADEPTG